jgi:DNA-binding CsgD family transcriptional regulator
MQRYMGRLENSADLHGELLAAIAAFTKTQTRLAQVIVLAAYRTAMRTHRPFGPQDAFKVRKGFLLIKNVSSGHCRGYRHALRDFWLDRSGRPAAWPLTGITVERLEPLALKLWRKAEELPLTGRELEVCQLLALGRQRAEIAEHLGVSENTAINHCRNLYGKLGVHSRAELVESLNARL